MTINIIKNNCIQAGLLALFYVGIAVSFNYKDITKGSIIMLTLLGITLYFVVNNSLDLADLRRSQ